MESVPQVQILLAIYIVYGGDGCSSPVQRGDVLFIVTFSLSVLSATFGVAKFIKSGPVRIINNDKCLMGFCSATFILIFLNIAATLVGRGIVISVFLESIKKDFESWHAGYKLYITLVILGFIPQLLHVSYSTPTWETHLKLCFDLFAGIPHPLLFPWHQESNKKHHCTTCSHTDPHL